MRKLVLGITVTADGFVCGPKHEPDWFMRRRNKSVKPGLKNLFGNKWDSINLNRSAQAFAIKK